MRALLVKVTFFLAFIMLSGLGVRYAVADYYYQSANERYRQVTSSMSLTIDELKPLIAKAEKAIRFRRGHADALDLQADLLYQQWWLSPDGQYLQQSSLLQRALELHLAARVYRKHWSFGAARLALIYSHQPALDERFGYWFLEAHRLGLLETKVARSLAELGLMHWSSLSQKQKALTDDFIRTSIEQKANSPRSMARLLFKYQKLATICENPPYSSRKKAMCDIEL